MYRGSKRAIYRPVRVRATWQKELIVHLDKHQRYPSLRLAKERRDPSRLRAGPDGSCSLDQHRQGNPAPRRSTKRAGHGAALRSGVAASAAGVPLTDGQLTGDDGGAAAIAILRGFEDVVGSRQAARPMVNYIVISIV